jgi:methylmalonyl-CoA mutase
MKIVSMSNKNFQKLLQQSFSFSNKDDWKRTATSELNGIDPFQQLLWKNTDGISFLPYYDKEDRSPLSYLDGYISSQSKDSFPGGRRWINQPDEFVSEELTANSSALNHLANGADGVLFYFTDRIPDFSKLLSDIHPEYCVLSFQGPFSPAHLSTF